MSSSAAGRIRRGRQATADLHRADIAVIGGHVTATDGAHLGVLVGASWLIVIVHVGGDQPELGGEGGEGLAEGVFRRRGVGHATARIGAGDIAQHADDGDLRGVLTRHEFGYTWRIAVISSAVHSADRCAPTSVLLASRTDSVVQVLTPGNTRLSGAVPRYSSISRYGPGGTVSATGREVCDLNHKRIF